ncbi:MAG: hypothetical protein SXV54_24315, partial [Chloroflexota bacterium]|nr:hypothetical protein [Chloroflexota bacterium]
AMTTLMQSSSAAIAVVLTAATGGVIPISTAASMVVGANIGKAHGIPQRRLKVDGEQQRLFPIFLRQRNSQ